MRINGAQALARSLEAQGVEVIFGYPGGAVLPIYDAFYDSTIRHILVRHEQGAAHMADGYARVSGKVGVCVATSGPGATNLVTGIANAYMDSIPMVAITGQVPRHMIGTDAFQESDIFGITLPIVKHSYLITDPREIPQVIAEAFHIAGTGRPGPVLIDIPSDVSKEVHSYKAVEKFTPPVGYSPNLVGHPLQLRKAVDAIRGHERPIIYAGGGVVSSGASAELVRLAEAIDAPVTTTIMGLGAYPENDRRSLGMLGMHGTSYANWAITRADLVLAIGVRFDDRVTGDAQTFCKDATIVHIDIDPAEIEKNVKVKIPIVGDVRNVLHQILKKLAKKPIEADRGEWWAQLDRVRKAYPLDTEDTGTLRPQTVIRKIKEYAAPDAIVSVDVGQHQMWAAQHFGFTAPNRWLCSSGLGTMGYGLPAAIGAQVAAPNTQVINIAGDGSIQMCIQELAVMTQEKLPVKSLIINNGFLGMVRQWQEQMYSHRYKEVRLGTDTLPDFVKLAEAYGMRGERITTREELDTRLPEILAHPGPALVDIRVVEEENVTPMVTPGGSVKAAVEDVEE